MSPRGTFALLACLLLSGCAADSPSSTPEMPSHDVQFEDDSIQVTLPTLPTSPPTAGERSLNTVPTWRLGEYWKYRIVDHFQNDRVMEVTRVVAGTTVAEYLVGFPKDSFSSDVLVFHVPGFGDVSKADLSFEVHDQAFTPLKFPLAEGETWSTLWQGRAGTARVIAASASEAELAFVGQGFNMTATYSAEAGEIIRLDFPGYASYEVVEHGFAYEGSVRVPHSHDVVFFHGRSLGVIDFNSGQPATTTEDVEVAPGYDQLAFTISLRGVSGLFGLPSQGGAAGLFSVKATAPDGSIYEDTMLPHEGGVRFKFFSADEPAGTWHLEHTAAGPGMVFIEGIGYHSIDVQLPSGCVVASFNAQHHAANCKVAA